MYQAPASFLSKLKAEFNGRLRIRWSDAKNEFHIEQQVGRAALPPRYIGLEDDRGIRARDGYHFILSVKAGNHVPCRTCNFTCPVPELRTGEIKCSRCGFQGRRATKEFGGYWPLNDLLIDYLKGIDPERDGHLRASKEQDLANARVELSRKRNIFNTVEAAAYDDKYQLFGTPFSGYTGKVLKGSSLNGKSL